MYAEGRVQLLSLINSDVVGGEAGFSRCLFHLTADLTMLTFHLSCSSFLALFISHYCFPLLPNLLGGQWGFIRNRWEMTIDFLLFVSDPVRGIFWVIISVGEMLHFFAEAKTSDVSTRRLLWPVLDVGSWWGKPEGASGGTACFLTLAALLRFLWAGRAEIPFCIGPWGCPAVATTQKESSTFSQKRFFTMFSLQGAVSLCRRCRCSNQAWAHAMSHACAHACTPTSPSPRFWELAPPHFTSASPGGTEQTRTLSFWKVTSGWRLPPHSEAPAGFARTDGLHATKALLPPELISVDYFPHPRQERIWFSSYFAGAQDLNICKSSLRRIPVIIFWSNNYHPTNFVIS